MPSLTFRDSLKTVSSGVPCSILEGSDKKEKTFADLKPYLGVFTTVLYILK